MNRIVTIAALLSGCIMSDGIERERSRVATTQYSTAHSGPAAGTDTVSLLVVVDPDANLSITIRNGMGFDVKYNLHCAQYERWDGSMWLLAPVYGQYEEVCVSIALTVQGRTFITHRFPPPRVIVAGTYRLSTWVHWFQDPDLYIVSRERVHSNTFELR
jgi:hypothetical protein